MSDSDGVASAHVKLASTVVLAGGKSMMIALLYLILGGAYLVVVPFALYIYLQKRWHVVSSFERAFMYFLVFFFFPGLILLGPFLNFRPHRRQIEV